jgi:hypothetical protein
LESHGGKQKGGTESRKALRKVERHCGKQKAPDESWKAVEETQKAVEENLIGSLGFRQYFTTYLIYPAIFMVHADDNDANDDNANNTNGF